MPCGLPEEQFVQAGLLGIGSESCIDRVLAFCAADVSGTHGEHLSFSNLLMLCNRLDAEVWEMWGFFIKRCLYVWFNSRVFC